MNYLSLNECLLLRQASKNVKRIVDSTFQWLSSRPQEKFQAEQTIERSRDFPSRCQRLHTLKQVESFIRETSTWLVPQGNPWLSGHILLKLKWLDHPSPLRLLISRYGMHVSSLAVTVECHFTIPSERIVNLLLELLSSTNFPNLKQLRVYGYVEEEFEPIFRERVDTFPEIPKLEALNIMGFDHHRLALPLLEKYGSQLKVLHCGYFFFKSKIITVDLLNNIVPNISFLEVSLVCGEGFQKLSQVGWKITHLIVHLSRFVKLLDLLQITNHFAPTLTHLELQLYACRFPCETKTDLALEREGMRPLMKLKILTISGYDAAFCRISDFVGRCCPRLETIYWSERKGVADDGQLQRLTERIRVFFGLVPKLRKIVFWYRKTGESMRSKITLRRGDVDI